MGLPLRIATRYLFARKSHNVINVISAISAAGMALGSAALILILSIYNGFDGIIRDNLSDLDPDILISSSGSKLFNTEGRPELENLLTDSRIRSLSSVLEENVFAVYDNNQCIATAKGVDRVAEEESLIGNHIVDGEFRLHRGDLKEAVPGIELAYKMGIRPHFVSPIVLYYPDRDAGISLADPSACLRSEKLYPSGLFSIGAATDDRLIIVPIETMRSLLGVSSGQWVSGLELRLEDPSAARKTASELQATLGPEYAVRTRVEQNPDIYRMMRYEKLSVFLILFFVVVIIAFNIYGSLSMLIIEKRADSDTLRALGAPAAMRRRIFVLEGWLISLSGLIIGLLAGTLLALAQQHFGFVKMPGGFMIDAYPVEIKPSDIILTALSVAATGLVTALIATPLNTKNNE